MTVVYAGPVAACDGHPGRTLYGPSGAQTVLDTSSVRAFSLLTLTPPSCTKHKWCGVRPPGPSCPTLTHAPCGCTSPTSPTQKGRLEATHFIRLLVRAIWHRPPQCWIAAHPVLAMAYLCQYLPTVAASLLRKIGPARTRALDAANNSSGAGGAQDAYSLSALLSKRPRSD